MGVRGSTVLAMGRRCWVWVGGMPVAVRATARATHLILVLLAVGPGGHAVGAADALEDGQAHPQAATGDLGRLRNWGGEGGARGE